jgi:hypothetical protein
MSFRWWRRKIIYILSNNTWKLACAFIVSWTCTCFWIAPYFCATRVNHLVVLVGSRRYDIMCLHVSTWRRSWRLDACFPRTAAAAAAQSCRDRHGGQEELGCEPVKKVWHPVRWNTKTECKRSKGRWIYCRECKYTSDID